ncbi:MAG: Wzz/FepE/Etk N-terminal domain-containing protein [Desulfobacteraceae bacterium]|nr:Wzz/FepE/Etk N-terminal domain-containing protein [Desulfobacteraceae bacterium]
MCSASPATKIDSQPLPPGAPYPYAEEDEINVLGFLVIILKYKYMIVAAVFLAGLLAVILSLMMDNQYRSEATISLREEQTNPSPLGALGGLGGLVASQLGLGGAGSLDKLEVVLKSRDLSTRIIQKYELLPILFPEAWDAKNKRWRAEAPPSMQDALIILQSLLSVSADSKKNTMMVGIEYKDPELAKTLVGYYLSELSNSMREEVIRDASENMRFFTEQLQKTGDAMLKEKIYVLMAKEVEKETFAKAQKYYGFLVVDPPLAPDPDKKISPKRSMICILSVMATFFGSCSMALLLEFLSNLKTKTPEYYQQIIAGLKGWRIPNGALFSTLKSHFFPNVPSAKGR